MFVQVASAAELPPGTVKEVEVAGRKVALLNDGAALHAFAGVCPHAGGPLGEGLLVDGVLRCPWHGWGFDVATGRCKNVPRAALVRHAVKVEGDAVLVDDQPLPPG